MFPNSLAASALKSGSFVLVADEHLDVPLYWQVWRVDSPIVGRITEAGRSAASGTASTIVDEPSVGKLARPSVIHVAYKRFTRS
jgi:hypothetical protein